MHYGEGATVSLLKDRAIALRRLQGMAMREQSAHYALGDLVHHENATWVPGRGSLEPRVAFVIERPAPGDATHRTPLTGKAGRVFDDMLAACGVLRAQVYVTHLVPWLPPRNRETTTQERDTCLPWLRRELRTVGSPPVVLLGRAVSEYLLVDPLAGFGTQRPYADLLGRWRFCPGLRAYCLSVRHPAYGVYQEGNLPAMRDQYRHITDSALQRNEILLPGDTDATV